MSELCSINKSIEDFITWQGKVSYIIFRTHTLYDDLCKKQNFSDWLSFKSTAGFTWSWEVADTLSFFLLFEVKITGRFSHKRQACFKLQNKKCLFQLSHLFTVKNSRVFFPLKRKVSILSLFLKRCSSLTKPLPTCIVYAWVLYSRYLNFYNKAAPQKAKRQALHLFHCYI